MPPTSRRRSRSGGFGDRSGTEGAPLDASAREEIIRFLRNLSRDGLALAGDLMKRHGFPLGSLEAYRTLFYASLEDKGNRELSLRKREALERLVEEIEGWDDGG